MELYSLDGRRPVIAISALAAAGLVLTGCASSSGSASTSAAAQSSGASSSTSSNGSASTVTSSGSLPFPSTAGDTWVYSNTNGAKSKNKVESVTRVSSGRRVLIEDTVEDYGVTTRTHYAYILRPDGEISLPFSQFSRPESSASFSVKLLSGGMSWPSAAQLASGKASHSTMTLTYTIDGKKQQVTMHITATGGGTQSVTVPAGTYRATVVNMLESETFDGDKVSTDVRTWLAAGVGPVQSEVVDVDGASRDILDKEELTSFVKG
jgi:hypothetical protein